MYATAKVAADFLTMNYHDAFGLPGVVTRMFNNYGPRQNPRYVTGTIITQALEREEIELGQLEPLRDFCFCTDGVRGHLTVAATGIPGDVYVYGQGENISMADWSDLIIRTGEEHGFWPAGRECRHDRGALPARRERGDGPPRRLREAQPRDRLGAEGDLGGGRRSARSAGTPRTATAGSAASTGSRRRCSAPSASRDMKILVTGGGGFLGSHLVERLRERGDDPFDRRAAPTTTSRAGSDAERLFDEREARARLPPRGRGRRDRRQPRQPRPLLVREPDDGRARARARAPARRRASSCVAGTVCAYPKFTPVPFREDELWNGYPEETNAPYGVAKKSILVGAQAYREQYGPRRDLPPAGEPLRAARQLRSRRTSHVIPALIRKMLESRRRDRAVGRRLADARVPVRRGRAEAFGLAAERYDGADPVNLGTGEEISIRDLAEPIAELTGFDGRDPVGRVDAERAAAPQPRRLTRRGSCSASRRGRRCARGSSGRSRGTGRRRPLNVVP